MTVGRTCEYVHKVYYFDDNVNNGTYCIHNVGDMYM